MNHKTMPAAVVESIETIANLEQEFLEQRTPLGRAVDAIASFTGTIQFILIHLAGFLIWFLINSNVTKLVHAFDPYPYILLGQVLSCEGVLLSTFVLMAQNRMSARSERRDHLHLQIALLTEKEMTKVLQALHHISEHQGLSKVTEDREARELSMNTALDTFAREVNRKLPGEGG